MDIENILGVRCEVIGKGLFGCELVVRVKEEEFSVPKSNVKFTQGEKEICYVKISDIPFAGGGGFLARIFSEGNCYKNIWCYDGNFVFSE